MGFSVHRFGIGVLDLMFPPGAREVKLYPGSNVDVGLEVLGAMVTVESEEGFRLAHVEFSPIPRVLLLEGGEIHGYRVNMDDLLEFLQVHKDLLIEEKETDVELEPAEGSDTFPVIAAPNARSVKYSDEMAGKVSAVTTLYSEPQKLEDGVYVGLSGRQFGVTAENRYLDTTSDLDYSARIVADARLYRLVVNWVDLSGAKEGEGPDPKLILRRDGVRQFLFTRDLPK